MGVLFREMEQRGTRIDSTLEDSAPNPFPRNWEHVAQTNSP